jgi:hypothetical protein
MGVAIERRSPVQSRARQIDFSPAKPPAVPLPSPVRTQHSQAQHKGSFQVGSAVASSRLASLVCGCGSDIHSVAPLHWPLRAVDRLATVERRLRCCAATATAPARERAHLLVALVAGDPLASTSATANQQPRAVASPLERAVLSSARPRLRVDMDPTGVIHGS